MTTKIVSVAKCSGRRQASLVGTILVDPAVLSLAVMACGNSLNNSSFSVKALETREDEMGEGFTAKAEGGQTDVTAVFCGEVSNSWCFMVDKGWGDGPVEKMLARQT